MKYQFNKKHILKKIDKLLQKQKDYRNKRNAEFKNLVRSYAELQNKITAVEENCRQMTQKNIKIFINEIYSKPPKKLATNKTDVYHIDDIWSLDMMDLKDYGPENNKKYRYVLVIIDNFSKFGWTVPLKNKNAQTI